MVLKSVFILPADCIKTKGPRHKRGPFVLIWRESHSNLKYKQLN